MQPQGAQTEGVRIRYVAAIDVQQFGAAAADFRDSDTSVIELGMRFQLLANAMVRDAMNFWLIDRLDVQTVAT